MRSSPRRRSASTGRFLRRALAVLVILVLGWLAVGVLVIVRPRSDRPTTADAVVVLGPSLQPRIDQAVTIARTFSVRELLISVGDTAGQATSGLCVDPPAGIRVRCFRPSPYTTRGEAREVGSVARAADWHTVIVLAPRAQLSRARLLVRRCYAAGLEMVVARQRYGLLGWAYQFGYQSAAFVKAFLEPGC